MAIISRLSLQGAVFRPLAGELASAVTYCVSNNSASLEPVTCWSGQVGRIRKVKGKVYIEFCEPPQFLHCLMDVLTLVASSTLFVRSQLQPSHHHIPLSFFIFQLL